MTTRVLIFGSGAVAAHLHLPALQRLRWLLHARVVDLVARALTELRAFFPAIQTCASDSYQIIDVQLPDFIQQLAAATVRPSAAPSLAQALVA
jgi:hypothetical protein